MRSWFDDGEVRFLAHEAERLASSVLDVVTDSAGVLNANERPGLVWGEAAQLGSR